MSENYLCSHILRLERDDVYGSIYFKLKAESIEPFSFSRGKWMIRIDAYVDSSKAEGFITQETDWKGSGLIILECDQAQQRKDFPENRVLCAFDVLPHRSVKNLIRPSKVVVNSDYVEIYNPANSDIKINLNNIRGDPVPLKEKKFNVHNYFLLISLKQVKQ